MRSGCCERSIEVSERVSGFVMANDGTPYDPLWKVRVKDSQSPYNGHKLTVASVHGDITLAQGLNVSFLIGSIDDKQGQSALRAVDVRLQEVNRIGQEDHHE